MVNKEMTGQDPYSIPPIDYLISPAFIHSGTKERDRLFVPPTELAKPYVPTVDSSLLPIATAFYPPQNFVNSRVNIHHSGGREWMFYSTVKFILTSMNISGPILDRSPDGEQWIPGLIKGFSGLFETRNFSYSKKKEMT